MMRTCPSRYRPYLEAEIARLMEHVRLDADLRADDAERIRALASVPDALIDTEAMGTLTIVVGVDEPERKEQAAA